MVFICKRFCKNLGIFVIVLEILGFVKPIMEMFSLRNSLSEPCSVVFGRRQTNGVNFLLAQTLEATFFRTGAMV